MNDKKFQVLEILKALPRITAKRILNTHLWYLRVKFKINHVISHIFFDHDDVGIKWIKIFEYTASIQTFAKWLTSKFMAAQRLLPVAIRSSTTKAWSLGLTTPTCI